MERRKIANEAEARTALDAVARAEIGLGAWARANGIDGRSLHAWEMVLARRAQTGTRAVRRPTSGLVELVPRSAAPQARYLMTIGGVQFEFGDDAQEETLRRVVGVLRAC